MSQGRFTEDFSNVCLALSALVFATCFGVAIIMMGAATLTEASSFETCVEKLGLMGGTTIEGTGTEL